MRVAVAGGTGMVGCHVVAALAERGVTPVPLARSLGVDLVTGQGLEVALSGVEVVVDVSNVTTTSRRTSVAFFTASTSRLLEAGRRAGVRHHVALSIVGVDRVDSGYYAGKRAQEELVLRNGPDCVPGTVLRATQFHEFAGQVLDRSRGPVAVVPRMRVQPVAAREVAAALADRALRAPVGLAAELAGPVEHELVDLARRLLQARGSRRALPPVRLPGADGRAMVGGALLPTRPGPRGSQTFDAWLTAQQEAAAASPAEAGR